MAFQPGNAEWTKREGRKLITSALERELIQFESEPLGIKPGQAAAEIARKVVRMALDGDKWAIELICDRTEGKPKQSTTYEHSGSVSVEHIGVEETGRFVVEALAREAQRALPQPVLN